MNSQLQQMSPFGFQQSSNIESTVFNGDLNLPETNFSDLFSEFGDSTNEINGSHSIPDSSFTYLHPIPIDNHAHNIDTVSNGVFLSNAYTPFIEHYENQQSNSNHISIDHHESVSTNMSYYQTNEIISAQQPITNSSVHLPHQLIENPKQISLTFNQFQALISARTETSKSNHNTISTLLENSTIIGQNIPLKIVNQIDLPTNKKTNNRTHRKSTHNASEKRYRSSINEKIHQLKDIVAIRDGKIQKSGILRCTIEYIRQLQSNHQRLEEENHTLKNLLNQSNLTHDDYGQSTKRNSSIQNRTKSKRGMSNGSRLVLCCFMLCILLGNPFHYLLDCFHRSDNIQIDEVRSKITSRTLQATTDYENWSFLSKQLIVWLLNITVCLVCMVKLFVHGESFVHQLDMDEYYIYKKKADQILNQNQFNEAYLSYEKCCEKLYVHIDQTYFYYFTSIPWQVSRLCLNLLYFGRWLTYWSGWTNSIDTRDYNLELNHCFLQLWKIEYHHSKSFLNLINLLLLTINTSINTGKKLDQNKRNEIYLLSALTLQKFNGFIIPYLLKFLQPIHLNDLWLLETDHLREFLVKTNVNVFKDQSLIESIRIQYYQYILYEDIKYQLIFHEEQETKYFIENNDEFDRYSWWKHCLQVIRCISSNKQNILSNQMIYHRIRIKQFVDERYVMIIETIHNILIELTDDNNETRMKLLKQLGESSRILIEMNHEDNFELAIKTLLLDGILSLRLRLITNSIIEKIPFLDDFQQELKYYKQFNHLMNLPKQRYYLFESIFRTSSGLNPLITETLFEHAIKQSNTRNLDTLSALVLFCYFSPSTIYRYQNILQQVLCTSSESNHFNRLQKQCLTLFRQSYLTL